MNSQLLDRLFTKGAAYLDIETLGLSAGSSPIHQMGLLIGQSDGSWSGHEFYPKPSIVRAYGTTVTSSGRTYRRSVDPMRSKPGERTVSVYKDWEQALRKHGDAFTQSQLDQGAWAHLQPNGKPPISGLVSYGSMTVSSNVRSGQSVGKSTADLFHQIAKENPSAIIWTANQSFEAKHLGLALESSGDLASVDKLFTYQSRKPSAHSFLLTSDPGVLRAKKAASQTGDWRGVWQAIKGIDHSQPGLKPLDIQDVLRAGQSYAEHINQKYSLGLNFTQSFAGVSLSTQAKLLGLPPEQHSAMADNMLSQIVGRRVAEHIESLEDLATMSRGSNPVLTASHRQALDWAWKMNQIKEASPLYAKKAVAMAMSERLRSEMTNTEYRHVVSDGNQQHIIEKVLNGSDIHIDYYKPKFRTTESYDEAIEALQKARPDKVDLNPISKQLESEIASMPKRDAYNYLQEIIHGTSREVESHLDRTLSNVPEHILSKITSQGTKKTSSTLMKLGIGGAVVAAAVTGIGIYKGFTKTFSDTESKNYKPINGLDEDSYGAYLRQTNTDFGSPYRGLLDSISLQLANILTQTGTPVYVANSVPVDQKIADFHDQMMQTPLQKKIIQSELTRSTLKSMSATYFLDPTLTTPVASEDYSRYGLNSKKKLVQASLSDFSYEVEDADTLVLKQGLNGIMGKSMSIRLAGIDAPEIEHNDEGTMSYLRYRQSQPYGEQARKNLQTLMKNASDIKIIVDPKSDTYGRSLGVIVADGVNINSELIKSGSAAALPFGDAKDDIMSRSMIANYENQAYRSKEGMWGSDYWRTYRQTMSDKVRTTNNTFTRLDRLASNMNLAALSTTMQYAETNSIDDYVNQAQNTLRPRLTTLNDKKKYEANKPINISYDSHTQNKYLDQLKFETKSNMKNYGNSNHDLLKTKSNYDMNQSMVIDSTYQTNSIYRDSYSSIVRDYRARAQKAHRGKLQRSANQLMNSKTQNADRW